MDEAYNRASPPPVKCQEEQVALIGTRRSQRSQRKIRPKKLSDAAKRTQRKPKKEPNLDPARSGNRTPTKTEDRRPRPTTEDPRLRPNTYREAPTTTEDRAHAYAHAGRPKIHIYTEDPPWRSHAWRPPAADSTQRDARKNTQAPSARAGRRRPNPEQTWETLAQKGNLQNPSRENLSL